MGVDYSKERVRIWDKEMQHFFVEPEQVKLNSIYIYGSDVKHIKDVLRMKVGEKIEISDGNNKKYLCEIIDLAEEQIIVEIIEEIESDSELPVKVCLYQGFPKGDKMDLIVQKAVELGVHEIIPVMTKRTIVKLDEKKAAKRVERYNSIAISAAKQANRGVIPVVKDICTFDEALEDSKHNGMNIIPYELAEGMLETRKVLDTVINHKSIGIFIGPEGGFDTREIEKAKTEGAKPITLGKRILRTETAGLAVLSILMYILEDRN